MSREAILAMLRKHAAPEGSQSMDHDTEAPRRTHKAIRACAEWLHYCVSIGWPKSALDDLEAMWWEHHDHRGVLKSAPASDSAERPSNAEQAHP